MSAAPAPAFAELLGSRPQLPGVLGTPALSWLKSLRSAALERVGSLSIPDTRDEDWRFTDISPLGKITLQPARAQTLLTLAEAQPFFLVEAPTRLVFVDGVFAPALSSVEPVPGLRIANLPDIVSAQSALIQPHLGGHAGFEKDIFSALNTAFLQDAAVLVASRNEKVAEPVHLLFIATQENAAAHPRCLVVAESSSEVSLIEDYVSLQKGAYFTNAVAEIVLADQARVQHIRVQRESGAAFHVGTCAVSLARTSHYQSVSIALGAAISRFNLNVVQRAEGAECSVDGLALIAERQLADTHTTIDHAHPDGVSRQLHKCIAGGAAHAVFNGRILVRPGAQRTDSAQSSRNLLLSGKAHIDTKPQLEIFADDVKCAHGATVGQLDADEVFYLRSRGLTDEAARNLLTYAFGAEIVERIPVASLRAQLEQLVLSRTGGAK